MPGGNGLGERGADLADRETACCSSLTFRMTAGSATAGVPGTDAGRSGGPPVRLEITVDAAHQ
ncbi:hypothetical protein, partial [Streptomyces sp. CO7]